jgi:Fe-Mn family superoxide dismutase
MTDPIRRRLLQSGLVALVTASASRGAESENTAMHATTASAFSHELQPKPLPFDPKSLRGLSEKLVTSHWQNNYVGAAKALNAVRKKLHALLESDDPPYMYNDFKREHLIRTGSVVLHELYFGNLGGDGQAAAEIRTELAHAFGSFDAWQSEFVRIGQGLGGGSGWVILGRNEHLGLLENYWLADHATNPPFTQPILVMDMYEHAYHMDYGAAAAKYIDAFFVNINWDTIGKRLEAA